MPVPPTTENTMFLKPTLHIEVIVKKQPSKPADVQELRDKLKQWFINCHATVKIGQDIVLEDSLAPSNQAFLDCVDIKQLIPSPSPAALYNIFRSCLNELIRSSLVNTTSTTTTTTIHTTPTPPKSTTRQPSKPLQQKNKNKNKNPGPSSPPQTSPSSQPSPSSKSAS